MGYDAIAGGISALLGVILGLFGDRWLRNKGDVHCQIQQEGLGAAYHRRQAGESAHLKTDQSIQIHFFNDKEVDTGLSEIAVVFVYEGGKVVLGPEARNYETSTSPRGMINLPSKTWVSVSIQGSFFGPDARLLEDGLLKAIDIEGKFPRGKSYHKRCLELS